MVIFIGQDKVTAEMIKSATLNVILIICLISSPIYRRRQATFRGDAAPHHRHDGLIIAWAEKVPDKSARR